MWQIEKLIFKKSGFCFMLNGNGLKDVCKKSRLRCVKNHTTAM